jgi:hypothetical protein
MSSRSEPGICWRGPICNLPSDFAASSDKPTDSVTNSNCENGKSSANYWARRASITIAVAVAIAVAALPVLGHCWET